MAKRECWIGVACKDRVFIGVRGNVAQFVPEKDFPLQKMDEGDWLIYYPPRLSRNGPANCQACGAVGAVAGHDPYRFDGVEGFLPVRPEADFELCREAAMLPCSDRLSFIEDEKSWAYPFRLGHLEISEEEFELLAEEMALEIDSVRH